MLGTLSLEKTRTPSTDYSQINQYLQQCGISSTNTSVLIHTDAEKAVGELFTKSGSQFSFAVRRSNPQQHQSTGGAERCVRRLKESLSILRADMSKCGVDIKFAHEPVQTALTYLSLCHNHFSKTPGTDLSPLENACGRRLSKPTSSLFCTTVMAELPDSVKQRVPNETTCGSSVFALWDFSWTSCAGGSTFGWGFDIDSFHS